MSAKSPSDTRPRIGVTLDSEAPGGYSKFPWFALRQNYASSIIDAGGLPLALPHVPAELIPAYLDQLDGLVVTGGAFDVDPALYGASERHPTVDLKAGRTAFEWAITKGALDRDLPVLGICGGQQLLNVVLGGTLIQHIPRQRARSRWRTSSPTRATRPATTSMSSRARCCTGWSAPPPWRSTRRIIKRSIAPARTCGSRPPHRTASSRRSSI